MSFNGGVPPPATGGSAPSDGDLVRRMPNDASGASQLRSIDQGGLRPVKKL